jgi:glycosidase
MKFLKLILIVMAIIFSGLSAQKFSIDKIEPPNWWAGMNLNDVQLMVYGSNLNGVEVKFSSDKIKVTDQHFVENNGYMFIDIELNSSLSAGDYELIFDNGENKQVYDYTILPRRNDTHEHNGFSNIDALYLLMPDRFVNGDPENDFVEGYTDTMQNIFAQSRRGGDLQGVINKLDYLKDLGFTTIWLTPVVENNTFRSYHGYAATDFYKVDPRLGSLDLYKKLVNEAHDRGMKIIMDHVSNHISIDHHWMENLPMQSWINGTVENHISANHHKMVYSDIHADSSTIREVQEGWFVDYMPDLNQANSFLANYIIQNTIWWIETTGVDGIREDTYPYCNQQFMAQWAATVLNEYHNFNIVGEVWTGETAILAGYQGNASVPRKYNSNLPAITDFALRDRFVEFLKGDKDLYAIYTTLSKDYLYYDPNNLLVFIDNHDIGRGMYYADTNMARMKMAYTLLTTLRGIPQIFYGSEIGMIEDEDHGTLRKSFPGGFVGDERDAFTPEGRTEFENEIYSHINRLLTLRKQYDILAHGELIHFPPEDELYVYFKKQDSQTLMCVANESESAMELDISKFSHYIGKSEYFKDLVTEKSYSASDKILIIDPLSVLILLPYQSAE